MTVHFTVPGEPVGKGRPRFTRTGHAFTPKKTADYERAVQRAYRQQCEGYMFPEDVPLRVTIIAHFGIPKTDSKAKRQMKLAHKMWPCKKPDGDNIAKAVWDSLNGLAYRDDSQIIDGRVIKVYGEVPKVTVTIGAIVPPQEEE